MSLGYSWESERLAELVRRESESVRTSVAEGLWALVGQQIDPSGNAPVAERLAQLRGALAPVRALIVENLSNEVVEETARRCGITRRKTSPRSYRRTDARELLDLRDSARAAALKGWLAASSGTLRFDEARELIPLVAAGELDLAIELVRQTSDPASAAEWVGAVWQRSPERAREESLEALRTGLPSAHGWFHCAPRAELPVLVDALTRLAELPDWASEWAFARALDAGEAAEKVFAISLQRAGRTPATE